MLFLSGFEHILDGCPCNLAARNFSYHSSGNLLREKNAVQKGLYRMFLVLCSGFLSRFESLEANIPDSRFIMY